MCAAEEMNIFYVETSAKKPIHSQTSIFENRKWTQAHRQTHIDIRLNVEKLEIAVKII